MNINLSCTVEELREMMSDGTMDNLLAGITAISKDGVELTGPVESTGPVDPTVPEAKPVTHAPAEEKKQVYTREQLMGASAKYLDQGGKMDELAYLVSTFGVESMTELPEDKLGEFAEGLKELGAEI